MRLGCVTLIIHREIKDLKITSCCSDRRETALSKVEMNYGAIVRVSSSMSLLFVSPSTACFFTDVYSICKVKSLSCYQKRKVQNQARRSRNLFRWPPSVVNVQTIAVITVAPTVKASFVCSYVQTSLLGQYSGN